MVFTAEDAKETWKAARCEKVVLVRLETSPEDIEGMARGAGHPDRARRHDQPRGRCGPRHGYLLRVRLRRHRRRLRRQECFTLAGKTYNEGDWISIDGSTGNIYGEAMPTAEASISGDFGRFMGWADAAPQAGGVHQRGQPPRCHSRAVEFGAEGIGLCRTEHMFFEADRIKAVREMIVADDVEARKKAALAKILPYQQGDFEAMYKVMGDRPMTIRYLDPPLHEFLPTKEEDIEELAEDLGITVEHLHNVIDSLHEFNPMMGHRGCRLAVSYPEIAEMQTTAVINAAINVHQGDAATTSCPTS